MSASSVDASHLRAFVERIERLEEEKRAIADDVKEVYAEAKGNGYDPKIVRKVVSLRRMDRDKRREEEELLELYLGALGELADTPLGRAAIDREFGVSKGVKRALNAMGTPVELTEEERAQGGVVAFKGKDGTRMSISTGKH